MTNIAIAILVALVVALAYIALGAHERIVGLEYRMSRARCAAWAYRETAVHYAGIVGIQRPGVLVDQHAEAVCARNGDDLTAADLSAEASGRPHDMETR